MPSSRQPNEKAPRMRGILLSMEDVFNFLSTPPKILGSTFPNTNKCPRQNSDVLHRLFNTGPSDSSGAVGILE